MVYNNTCIEHSLISFSVFVEVLMDSVQGISGYEAIVFGASSGSRM